MDIGHRQLCEEKAKVCCCNLGKDRFKRDDVPYKRLMRNTERATRRLEFRVCDDAGYVFDFKTRECVVDNEDASNKEDPS